MSNSVLFPWLTGHPCEQVTSCVVPNRQRLDSQRIWRRFLNCLVCTACCLTTLISPAHAQIQVPKSKQQGAFVSPFVESVLTTPDAQSSFLVILKDQLDVQDVLFQAGVQSESRIVRAATIYKVLSEHAVSTQKQLVSLLEARGASYNPFYIVNMIEVEGDGQLLDELSRHPDVDRIEANPIINNRLSVFDANAGSAEEEMNSWFTRLNLPQALTRGENTIVPGVKYTNAPLLWDSGFTGEGIVLAGQDTGVEWNHPALKARYRGYDKSSDTVDHIYHWFDAWGSDGRPAYCNSDSQIPCDDHGHGTHTVGTMLGDASTDPHQRSYSIIGMAPDAQWIGCRNMKEGVGRPSSYTACFEFFLAPYPQGGNKFTDGRPELGPDIINNSWGCPPEEGCDTDSLRQVVDTMRAAGQFVIASAGNDGSRCGSVSNPISMHDAVFSVGAHNVNGQIAAFSSRGPVTSDGSNRLKPDISAPGVSIYSSTISQRGGYSSSSGTSMASPHMAGAAALLWSAVPNISGKIDLSEQILIKSATPKSSIECGDVGIEGTPNYIYGYGNLDVSRAAQVAQTPATAEVNVLDCEQTPLVGAQVQLIDHFTGYVYSGLSDETGHATIPQIYAVENVVVSQSDSFTVTASAGLATFGAISTTLAAGARFTTTLQALSCASPSSVTVEVDVGNKSTEQETKITLISQSTGFRYRAIPATGTATFLPTKVLAEFHNVLADDYWIEVEVDAQSMGTSEVTVAPGSQQVIDVTIARDIFLPLLLH